MITKQQKRECIKVLFSTLSNVFYGLWASISPTSMIEICLQDEEVIDENFTEDEKKQIKFFTRMLIKCVIETRNAGMECASYIENLKNILYNKFTDNSIKSD